MLRKHGAHGGLEEMRGVYFGTGAERNADDQADQNCYPHATLHILPADKHWARLSSPGPPRSVYRLSCVRKPSLLHSTPQRPEVHKH